MLPPPLLLFFLTRHTAMAHFGRHWRRVGWGIHDVKSLYEALQGVHNDSFGLFSLRNRQLFDLVLESSLFSSVWRYELLHERGSFRGCTLIQVVVVWHHSTLLFGTEPALLHLHNIRELLLSGRFLALSSPLYHVKVEGFEVFVPRHTLLLNYYCILILC